MSLGGFTPSERNCGHRALTRCTVRRDLINIYVLMTNGSDRDVKLIVTIAGFRTHHPEYVSILNTFIIVAWVRGCFTGCNCIITTFLN